MAAGFISTRSHWVVLATIEDPAVIRRILTRLGLSTDGGEPLPARAPPAVDDSPA